MSPTPGLRNRGQSVVEQISDKRHIPNLTDARDRMVAHRNRHATGWEAAAETLATRADRVRVNNERGRNFAFYSDDVRRGKAMAPGIVAAAVPALPTAPPSYWLGLCLDCERGLWVHTQRPRVPLCERCRSKR